MGSGNSAERQTGPTFERKSPLSPGKNLHSKEAKDLWKTRIDWFTPTPQYRDLDLIDGEPKVFNWTNFPGHTTLQLLGEVERMMSEMDLCT